MVLGGWVEGGRIQSKQGRENRTKERLRPHFLLESTLNVNHGEGWGVRRSPKDRAYRNYRSYKINPHI